jgi:quercetin dioxygenase-like cupin family protein
MGMLMTVKADAQRTDGACSAMEVTFPPDTGPPLHIHRAEAELNFVLEGSMRFRCDDQELEAGSGGFVYLPRGHAHTFKTGLDGARMFAVTLPGGLDRLYALVGEPATGAVLPTAEPNIAGWLEHAGQFGIEITGPPL